MIRQDSAFAQHPFLITFDEAPDVGLQDAVFVV